MKKVTTKLWKSLLLIVVLFSMQNAYSQTRNRLSVMVQNAQYNETFVPLNLFTVTQYEGAEQFATGGTALLVDEQKLQQVFQQKNAAITLSIPTASGKLIELDLVKVNIATTDFKVTTQNLSNTNYEQGVYYRGIIKGDFNSVAAVSVFNDDIMILFANDEGNFNLGKIRDRSGKYFLYNDHLALHKPSIDCAVDYTLPESTIDANKNGTASTSTVLCKAVKCYYEADFAMYQAFSSNTTTTANYVTSIFNVKATLYQNDGIPIVISEIKVWTVTDPHAALTTTSTVNNSFISNIGTAFNGDMANFLTTRNLGGGIAQGFSGQCNKSQAHCTSMIYTTFSPFPTYSWTCMVITHEMGHLMGSRHTHACVWNGNNTAIDGCSGATEGGCALPGIPSGGGTIMSYCHQQSVGINFNLGFGPQPAAFILNIFNTATCYTGSSAVAPTGLTTSLITATTAKLNWNVSAGATEYNVEYKLASAATYTPLGTFTTNTANLTGLAANTAYNWRVNADCSPMTTPVTFTTTALAGCGVPTGTASTNIGFSTARIYWNAFAGASNYKTRYRKVGTTAWTTANIATAFRNITGLTALTQYEWQVKSLCSGVWTAWAAKKKFTTISNAPPTGYCASNATNSSFEYINNVTIGTINNTSGNNAGYADYTAQSTSSALGTTVNLNVTLITTGTYTEYVSVFVDFNRDGDFDDAGETAYTASGTNLTFTGSFLIPATASAGLTRMRVSMQYSAAPPTCGTFTYGEVEDYLLNITSPLRTIAEVNEEAVSELTIAPNPATSNIQVTLDAEEGNYKLEIYSMTGQLMKQLSFTGIATNVDVNDLQKGVYQITVVGNENRFNKMFIKQ